MLSDAGCPLRGQVPKRLWNLPEIRAQRPGGNCGRYRPRIRRGRINHAFRVKTPPFPKVSILLPTRNQASLLANALTCLAKQTYPSFELLVCDDASTDGTASVLASFRDRFRKHAFFRNRRRKGVVETLRALLSRAEGTFILSTASDDFIHDRNFLKEGFRQMTRFPELAGFFCDCRLLDAASGRVTGRWIYPAPRGPVAPGVLMKHLWNDRSFIPGAACVLKREFWDGAAVFLDDLGPQLDYYLIYSSGLQSGLCYTGKTSVSISLVRDKSSFGSDVSVRKSLVYHASFEARLRKLAGSRPICPAGLTRWRLRKFSEIVGFDHDFRVFRKRLFTDWPQAQAWRLHISSLAAFYRRSFLARHRPTPVINLHLSFRALVWFFYQRAFYKKIKSLRAFLNFARYRK